MIRIITVFVFIIIIFSLLFVQCDRSEDPIQNEEKAVVLPDGKDITPEKSTIVEKEENRTAETDHQPQKIKVPEFETEKDKIIEQPIAEEREFVPENDNLYEKPNQQIPEQIISPPMQKHVFHKFDRFPNAKAFVEYVQSKGIAFDIGIDETKTGCNIWLIYQNQEDKEEKIRDIERVTGLDLDN